MVIANEALRASLAIYHLISNTRSWNNCEVYKPQISKPFSLTSVVFRLSPFEHAIPQGEYYNQVSHVRERQSVQQRGRQRAPTFIRGYGLALYKTSRIIINGTLSTCSRLIPQFPFPRGHFASLSLVLAMQKTLATLLATT